MRRRSPSYSPPRRGYGGRGRSPPRGRYGAHRDGPCGLLVRNISKGSRPEDLRIPFERFGRVRDVYLPRDYYSGEPRGFGFVQYLDAFDAAEAKRHMDRQILNGREITVVFAEENRKRPDEMKMKERGRGRMSYGGGRRSPHRGYSPARSPRYRSPTPRDGRYSRSYEGASRRDRYESMSPPPRGRSRMSRSPDAYRKERDQRDLTPEDELDISPVKDGHVNSDGHRKRGRHSASVEKSYSPRSREATPPAKQQSKFRSPPRDSRSRSRSPSPRSPPPRRQRHASSSMSPRSRSPPPRRQRHPPSNSRDMPDPAQKTYSSLTPEERSPRGPSSSPGPSS